MKKILVVDDDVVLRESLKEALSYQEFQVESAEDGAQAINKISDESYDLVLMDVNMPQMNGIEALEQIKKINPAVMVIILTAYSNISDAVKAVKIGAYNYLEKPINTENLISLIKRALKAKLLVETTAYSSPRVNLNWQDESDQFVGSSACIKKIFNIIYKLARVNTPVMVTGESGTGKELVAKAIHLNGPRKDSKFVAINCGAIPENLIESELFGHEKGAFTHAQERKIGKFQYANGGTIFLDEIGDISTPMQVKLLRFLQDKKFTPIGSNREITVDVRIIAATNKNLEKLIKEDRFREDLYFRLNVLPVYLPPLRERVTDIPLLINYYIQHFNDVHQMNISGVSPKSMEILTSYHWPGNIRELKNVIEYAFILEPGSEICEFSLPPNLTSLLPSTGMDNNGPEKVDRVDLEEMRAVWQQTSETLQRNGASTAEEADEIPEQDQFTWSENDFRGPDFQQAKNKFEKIFISEALKKNHGKINQTALKANIPKKTLLRKIEKYGINPKSFH